MMSAPLEAARAALEGPDPAIGTALGNINEALLRSRRIPTACGIIRRVVRRWPAGATETAQLRTALAILEPETEPGQPVEQERAMREFRCEKCGRSVCLEATSDPGPVACPFHGGSTYYLRPVAS